MCVCLFEGAVYWSDKSRRLVVIHRKVINWKAEISNPLCQVQFSSF